MCALWIQPPETGRLPDVVLGPTGWSRARGTHLTPLFLELFPVLAARLTPDLRPGPRLLLLSASSETGV